MKHKTALYLFLASIGILGLAVAGAQKPQKTRVSNIDASDIGEKFLVEGKILESYRSDSTTFLTVSDGEENLSVISFSSRKIFSKDENITFSGRVTLYHGELEIVVDRFYT